MLIRFETIRNVAIRIGFSLDMYTFERNYITLYVKFSFKNVHAQHIHISTTAHKHTSEWKENDENTNNAEDCKKQRETTRVSII